MLLKINILLYLIYYFESMFYIINYGFFKNKNVSIIDLRFYFI